MRDADARARALATPRHFDTPIAYPGVGLILFQLAFVPSFGAPILWEIRERGGSLAAFRSIGVAPGSPNVIGHDVLAVPEDRLRTAVARLNGLSFSVSPSTPTVGIADADVYIATIHCGFETYFRLSWCADHAPAAWSPAVEALLLLRTEFESTVKAG
jgi:hypothetical protein